MIGREKIEVHVDTESLVGQQPLRSYRNGTPVWIIAIEAQLRRSGKVVRFVQADGSPASQSEPQQHLVKLFQLAHDWCDEMLRRGCSATELAARREVDKTYVFCILRLRFLSPGVVEKILSGEQPPGLNARRLLGLRSLPLDSNEQESLLLSC